MVYSIIRNVLDYTMVYSIIREKTTYIDLGKVGYRRDMLELGGPISVRWGRALVEGPPELGRDHIAPLALARQVVGGQEGRLAAALEVPREGGGVVEAGRVLRAGHAPAGQVRVGVARPGRAGDVGQGPRAIPQL